MSTHLPEPLSKGASSEADPVQAVSPRGRFFTDQTFHFETPRSARATPTCERQGGGAGMGHPARSRSSC